MYHAAWARSAIRTVSFSGITRPVPASVFDLPTVSCFFDLEVAGQRIRPQIEKEVLPRTAA